MTSYNKPLIIHAHEGGTLVFRRKTDANVPLWELTVKGTISLNQESLRSIFEWINRELPIPCKIS